MYAYPAGATGLDAAMPPWVQAGGNEAWFARLRDPAIRKRVAAEMRAEPVGWENLMRAAGGAENVLIVELRNPELKAKYMGKTLAEIAKLRGTSPEEAAMDLVAEDETRVGTVYFLMSEDEVRRKVALPYMNFGSDGAALSAEGVFLKSGAAPARYGNFARVLGRYVRDEKLHDPRGRDPPPDVAPGSVLNLRDRGAAEGRPVRRRRRLRPREDPGPRDLRGAAPVRDRRLARHRERRARARERRADRGAARAASCAAAPGRA